MVKKPERSFVAGVTHQPPPHLWLAYEAPHPAYSMPVESGTGGGCKTYGLEDSARIYYRDRRSGTAVTQPVLGDRKPDSPSPESGTCAPQRRRAQSPRRDRPEAREARPGGGG